MEIFPIIAEKCQYIFFSYLRLKMIYMPAAEGGGHINRNFAIKGIFKNYWKNVSWIKKLFLT